MTMILTRTVLLADVPNKNGRMYSRTAIEEALAKVQDGHGSLAPNDSEDINYWSHAYKNLRLEGDELKADITVMDTPHGKILQQLLEEDVGIAFRPRGIGQIRKNGDVTEIYDYTITSIDAMPEEQAA
jgi:hypothetical protein